MAQLIRHIRSTVLEAVTFTPVMWLSWAWWEGKAAARLGPGDLTE